MSSKLLAAVSVVAGILVTSASLADQQSVSWSDLAPDVTLKKIENPFKDLLSDQLDDLRFILRFQEGRTNQSNDAERAKETRERLAEQGLDVDWMFEQRRLMIDQSLAKMRATNDEIIGADVRLPGYVLPLEMKDQKVVEFLLVPTVGACIHTPPPPANQMVRVVYPEGIEVNGLYDPVWISGVMTSELSQPNVNYSDGQLQVEVTYAMEPTSVVPYTN